MSRKNSSNTGLKTVLILLMAVMIAATAFLIKLCLDVADYVPDTTASTPVELPTEPTTQPPETTVPVPEHVVSTATIGAMGDLLMHMPVVNPCRQADGTYDFESIFRYLTEYSSALDYAAVNLETTLCGTDNGYEYHGFPHFNCPDEIVDGAMDAGFDMMLTANNHSYDTSLVGYKRTLEVIREKGMDTLGTYTSADETKWHIQEVNGINIGMLCYTYATGVTDDGRPSLNGNMAISEKGICNYFYSGTMDSFYREVETYLAEMEEAGAEATVIFLHWGIENQLSANDDQKKMAQKLCDLGIDVIIGGHPHVVQPVELLTSADETHTTVCLYSMGNAVSNQRLGNLDSINTAHTEDGVLFSVTFEKYSDGTVYLAGADLLPTWVNMHDNNGKREYNILPLDIDRRENWAEMFETSAATADKAEDSYDRTMEIVGEGMKTVQDYLTQAKEAREDYYYDLAFHPEKFATEAPTEPAAQVTETAAAA